MLQWWCWRRAHAELLHGRTWSCLCHQVSGLALHHPLVAGWLLFLGPLDDSLGATLGPCPVSTSLMRFSVPIYHGVWGISMCGWSTVSKGLYMVAPVSRGAQHTAGGWPACLDFCSVQGSHLCRWLWPLVPRSKGQQRLACAVPCVLLCWCAAELVGSGCVWRVSEWRCLLCCSQWVLRAAVCLQKQSRRLCPVPNMLNQHALFVLALGARTVAAVVHSRCPAAVCAPIMLSVAFGPQQQQKIPAFAFLLHDVSCCVAC